MNVRSVVLAATVLLSWLGSYVHNRLELPMLTLLSPENAGTALVSLALFSLWRFTDLKRTATVGLLLVGVIHLLGGGVISVIPFGFLPFYPEQTLAHYAAHLIYGVTQLPLIFATARTLRTARTRSRSL